MKPIIIALALLAFAGSAHAQQRVEGPQQITPSQMAIQIDNAVNGLASSIEALRNQITAEQSSNAGLQKEIADLQKQLDDSKKGNPPEAPK
jgi:peptidoglycan hydrolase CwlO-like protein